MWTRQQNSAVQGRKHKEDKKSVFTGEMSENI